MTSAVAAALTWPVVYGTALVVLVLVVVAGPVVGALVTVVHEGGHMVVGILTGHKILHFSMDDGDNAGTQPLTTRWGPGRMLTVFAGYVAPPVVGLGGVMLLEAGRAWLLLWIAVVLMVLAWIKAKGDLAMSVVIVVAAGVGYIALYGSPVKQAAVACALVWLLLFGGVRSAVYSSIDDGSDAAMLAHDTLIPRSLWWAAFVVVAVACLIDGAVRLLAM